MKPRLASLALAGGAAALASLAWGCAQIIGADFDKPFQGTSSASAGGGVITSASAGGGMSGAGGAGSSTSSATSAGGASGTGSTSSATSSTSTGATCGMDCYEKPDGAAIPGLTPENAGVGICKAGMIACPFKNCVNAQGPLPDDVACGPLSGDSDEDCNGVVGFNHGAGCTVAAFTSILHMGPCTPQSLVDLRMSASAPIANYDVVASFHVFTAQQMGTVPIHLCVDGANHSAVVNAPCSALGGNFVDDGTGTLGYVATQGAPGYVELYYLSQMDTSNVVLVPESAMVAACCLSGGSGVCAQSGVFALP